MTTSTTDRTLAEAASWVTRLHGPERGPELEAGLKRWLGESAEHRSAFEAATEVWYETANLPFPDRSGGPHPRSAGQYVRALAASLILISGLATFVYLGVFSSPSYGTDLGEQRTLVLSDGTRVTLNTGSEIVEHYTAERRSIELRRGEALFDVAKDSRRPFAVMAGGRIITALGTVFTIRVDDGATAVTLLDGRISVNVPGAARDSDPALDVPVLLSPGQRLTIPAAAEHSGSTQSGPATYEIDKPALARVTAWQRGQLIFENTPLREAAAEFNRYGPTKIELSPGATADIPVGGVFRTADALLFAQAVAASHDLRLEVRGKTLLLSPP